jgi:hypothetical protein
MSPRGRGHLMRVTSFDGRNASLCRSRGGNLIRENLNVVLALVDALVASPKGRLTGGRRGDRKRDRCERHLTFEVGRRADWAGVLENAADFAAGLES